MFDVSLGIGLILIGFGVLTLAGGLALWGTTRLFNVGGNIQALMIAYIISSLIWMIPYIGGLLGAVVLVFLIKQFTSAETGPAIGMMLISDIVGVGAVFLVYIVILSESVVYY